MEPELLNEQGVLVTPKRFVVGATTYAARNITSVESAVTRYPAKRGGAWFCILITLLGMFLLPASRTPERVVIFWILPFGALATWLWRRAKARDVWEVKIHTAGVEKKAFLTEDQSLHRRVLDALNRAIVG